MNYLINQSLLLLYCLGSLLFVPAEMSFVIAFFLTVSVCTILYARTEGPAGFAFVCCFLLTAVLIPEMTCFAPAATCFFCHAFTHSRGVWKKLYHGELACGIAVFFCRLCLLHDPRLIFYLALGIAAALLLCYRTYSYEQFAGSSRRKYDDDHEKKLILEAKNRALIHQQDSEIYAATLKERTRIAREIHDNVGHLLTRSILMVGALRAVSQTETDTELAAGQCGTDTALAQLEGSLNEAMNSIRESVHNLHDSSVDLKKTLRALTDSFPFCPVTFQYDAGRDVPTEVRHCMIAVVKEALANISRHSNATKASVTVQEHPAFYQLSIRDNGTQPHPTFSETDRILSDPEDMRDPADMSDPWSMRGIGLSNMKSRVSALNGSLRILQKDGFCIHITIPKS